MCTFVIAAIQIYFAVIISIATIHSILCTLDKRGGVTSITHIIN